MRAPTRAEMQETVKRVTPCFEYASRPVKFENPHLELILCTELLRSLRVVKYPLNIHGDLPLIFVRTKLWVCHKNITGVESLINKNPGGEVANIVLNKYGAIDYEWGIKSASTDFVRRLQYPIYLC